MFLGQKIQEPMFNFDSDWSWSALEPSHTYKMTLC